MVHETRVKSEIVLRQNQFPDTNFTTNIVVNNELTPVLVDISTPPAAHQLLHLYSEMKFETLVSRYNNRIFCKHTKH
jgi:iron complex outermembrane receptor protein